MGHLYNINRCKINKYAKIRRTKASKIKGKRFSMERTSALFAITTMFHFQYTSALTILKIFAYKRRK